MLLALLTFCSFFLALLDSLEHGGHVCQPFLAPILLVGLMFIRQLSSKLSEGLTILIPMAAVSRVMSLMSPTMNLGFLAKKLTRAFFGTQSSESLLVCPSWVYPCWDGLF